MVQFHHASRHTDQLYARPRVEFALAAVTLGRHPVAAAVVIATAAVHELLAFASTQLLAFDDDICP